MIRPVKIVSDCCRQRDWFSLVLLAVVVAISCFSISILFSRATREIAIRRFHVATPGFAQWAVSAPVPSMYNFENRIWFTNELSEDQPLERDEKWFTCPVNHFPARCMTFGEFAPTWFAGRREGTFEMSTRFRETELVSRWQVNENTDGEMLVRRVSENWVRHDSSE